MNELERLVTVLATCEHPNILIQELRTMAGDPVRRCLQCGAISHTEAETGWKPWAGFRELQDAFRSLDSALSTGKPLPSAWSRTSHEDLFREYLLLHQRARLAAIDRDTCLDSIIGILPPTHPKPIRYTTAPPGETPGATARRWAAEDLARPVAADRAPRPIVRAMCPHCDHPISRHNLPGSPGALGTGCLVYGCKCGREIFTAAERGFESVTPPSTANDRPARAARELQDMRESLEWILKQAHAESGGSDPLRLRLVIVTVERAAREVLARYPRAIPTTTHVLFEGHPLCGFMAGSVMTEWPAEHDWVTIADVSRHNGGVWIPNGEPRDSPRHPCVVCLHRIVTTPSLLEKVRHS